MQGRKEAETWSVPPSERPTPSLGSTVPPGEKKKAGTGHAGGCHPARSFSPLSAPLFSLNVAQKMQKYQFCCIDGQEDSWSHPSELIQFCILAKQQSHRAAMSCWTALLSFGVVKLKLGGWQSQIFANFPTEPHEKKDRGSGLSRAWDTAPGKGQSSGALLSTLRRPLLTIRMV